jgi:hypothetical protein
VTNALGIAAVTAVLKDRLNDAVINANVVADVRVSAQPPDGFGREGSEPMNRLNLFLYRVERNQGWANACLPERRSSGEKVANSYLAIDLHYLLSAYGNSDMEAEVLLGYAMQILHETPILDRDAIRASLGGGIVNSQLLPDAFDDVSAADIADQVEQVKITHHSLTIEEEWRLWAALNTGLRPSATYKVSVLLIETRGQTQSALPVQQARLLVDQIRRPRIQRLLSKAVDNGPLRERAYIRRGQFLVLQGSGLRGLSTKVRLGGADFAPAEATDSQITIGVPTTTRPGLLSVQVVHEIPRPLPVEIPTIDPPPVGDASPMVGELSNAVVAPISLGFAADPFVSLTNRTSNNGLVGVDVLVRFDHAVGRKQRISLLLNEHSPPSNRGAYAFTIDATKTTGPGDTMGFASFKVRGVPEVLYVFRVQVDGVESELQLDNGRYDQPQLDLRAQ